ncbi:MAG: MmgE/PrpD family protein [Thermoleophilaceae bacterium]
MSAATSDPYRRAFVDWLACAAGGSRTAASRAALAAADDLCGRVVALGTAGHALDFDDTYLPGRAHLSAPVAPAALLLAAASGRSIGEALAAYAAGFEAMGAVAAASVDELYARGWHPTSLCGVVGASVAATRILELDPGLERRAVGIALLTAGGLQAVFGSHGKPLQVGLSAAAGVRAAQLAASGADVRLDDLVGPRGAIERAYGMTVAQPRDGQLAVAANRIKPWPCCLQTHGAIDAASRVRLADIDAGASIAVRVPSFARQAASYDDVDTGLEAKFSIPYATAYTLLHGTPSVEAFERVDPDARALAAKRVRVVVDDDLGESEAALFADATELARVEHPLGTLERPMNDRDLAAKTERLAGVAPDELMARLDDPAEALLERTGLAEYRLPASAVAR